MLNILRDLKYHIFPRFRQNAFFTTSDNFDEWIKKRSLFNTILHNKEELNNKEINDKIKKEINDNIDKWIQKHKRKMKIISLIFIMCCFVGMHIKHEDERIERERKRKEELRRAMLNYRIYY